MRHLARTNANVAGPDRRHRTGRRSALALAGAVTLLLGVTPVAAIAGAVDELTSSDSGGDGSGDGGSDGGVLDGTVAVVEDTAAETQETVADTVASVTTPDDAAPPGKQPPPAEEPDDPTPPPERPTPTAPEPEPRRDRSGAPSGATGDEAAGDTDEVDAGSSADGEDRRSRPPGFGSPLRLGTGGIDWDVPSMAAVADSPRSTTEVLELLRQAGASSATIARVLAPFPVAGPASYEDAGTPAVDLTTSSGTPVIAAAAGTIRLVDVDRGAGVELTSADGARYRYEGLRPRLAVADGDEVIAGQTLGDAAALGFEAATVRFALWGPDGGQRDAIAYLDRWLAEATTAAQALADAQGGAFSPQVAPPADAGGDATGGGPLVADPDTLALQRSGFAPSDPGGSPPAIAVIVGMLVAALLAYGALRPGRRRLALDAEGFLGDLPDVDPSR